MLAEYGERILWITQKLSVAYWVLRFSFCNRRHGLLDMFCTYPQNTFLVVSCSSREVLFRRWSKVTTGLYMNKVWKRWPVDWLTSPRIHAKEWWETLGNTSQCRNQRRSTVNVFLLLCSFSTCCYAMHRSLSLVAFCLWVFCAVR